MMTPAMIERVALALRNAWATQEMVVFELRHVDKYGKLWFVMMRGQESPLELTIDDGDELTVIVEAFGEFIPHPVYQCI